MAEFASKGVAGTALGLGIAGTVGLVNQLSGGNCGCGNGLLGGLFGGNCCNRGTGSLAEVQYISALQSENGQLKAENYSDRTSLEAHASVQLVDCAYGYTHAGQCVWHREYP